jgi:hypothetical protein
LEAYFELCEYFAYVSRKVNVDLYQAGESLTFCVLGKHLP